MKERMGGRNIKSNWFILKYWFSISWLNLVKSSLLTIRGGMVILE